MAEVDGVRIFGPLNLPAEMPVHASQMYSRTVAAMIDEFVKDDAFATDFADEIFAGACVTHAGKVVNDTRPKLWVLGDCYRDVTTPLRYVRH